MTVDEIFARFEGASAKLIPIGAELQEEFSRFVGSLGVGCRCDNVPMCLAAGMKAFDATPSLDACHVTRYIYHCD